MAASFIERLPDEGDPQRSIEETIAKNVALVAYAGAWCTWPILDALLISLSTLRGRLRWRSYCEKMKTEILYH